MTLLIVNTVVGFIGLASPHPTAWAFILRTPPASARATRSATASRTFSSGMNCRTAATLSTSWGKLAAVGSTGIGLKDDRGSAGALPSPGA